MKPLDKKAKREKERIKKEKLAIRQVCKTTPKEKKGPTGEFELFKKIAEERAYGDNYTTRYVKALHIDTNGIFGYKSIYLTDLTPTNFSHTIPKSRGEKYRLDPNNIEIVSRAYHHYEHTRQILKVEYPN